MRSNYERQIAEQIEIEGHLLSGRDKLVLPNSFGPVCRLLWPDKTAANLAAIGGRDERTAKRWLSGEYEPPIVVLLAVITKMMAPRQ